MAGRITVLLQCECHESWYKIDFWQTRGVLGNGVAAFDRGVFVRETNNQELIAAIYAATLSPKNFDEMADDLEAQAVRVLSAITGRPDITEVLPGDFPNGGAAHLMPDLAKHIENAHDIQSQIGHRIESAERTDLILEIVPNPAFVIDADERIVRKNALAQEMQSGACTALADLFRDPEELAGIRDTLSTLRQGSEFASLPISLDAEQNKNTCVVVKLIQAADGSAQNSKLYLLTIADFGFSSEISDLFQQTYGLTDAETEIAVLLASGTIPQEIASNRSVSLQTVRTQIKSIKAKTKTRNLPDLVRLLCGFSAGMVVPAGKSRQETAAEFALNPTVETLVLPDGRRMEYVEQGDRNGRPVLLLHNMPYGVYLPGAAQRFARDNGLRIIAPYRPAHGDSDPLPAMPPEKYLDQVVDDMKELADALALPPVALLGNGGGSSFAVRFATAFPDRVSNIVMVSRAPVWRGEWLDDLPPRQKLTAVLLKYVPRMGELFTWAILSHVNKHSAVEYAKTAADGSPGDLLAIENPETMLLFTTGVTHGLKQGSKGFCRDWELMEVDLTPEARLLPHDMHIVVGADDRIILPEQARQFANDVPRATIEVVEGAGNYMFYSHWRHVMNALVRESLTAVPAQ